MSPSTHQVEGMESDDSNGLKTVAVILGIFVIGLRYSELPNYFARLKL